MGWIDALRDDNLERVKGIEPSYEAWEAAVLPLNYTRKYGQLRCIVVRILKKLTFEMCTHLSKN